MSSLTLGDLGSLISAGVALLASIGSLAGYILARRERASAAALSETAVKAAIAAADAERLSSRAAERSAAALEEQNRVVKERELARAQAPWKFEHVANQRWRLTNELDRRAFAVTLLSAKPIKGLSRCEQLDGKGSIEFMVVNGGGHPVTVTWHWRSDCGDQMNEWTNVLPRPS